MPAHNEAAVVQRTLAALTQGALPGELEVIVVCNGCTDETAAMARACSASTGGRQNGADLRILETPIAGKIKALNLGDQAAQGFPRVYIDADVLLPLEVLRKLVRVLEDGRILAAAPQPSFDVTGSPWTVRAYYAINGRLPSSREGIGGSGVYALSRQGRSRFGAFPELTADDGFVRIQFKPDERATLADCCSTVFAPQRLSDLIAIKTRSHFGSYELRQKFPELWANKGQSNGGHLLRLWRNPLLWPQLTVYCYVKLIARLRARRRLRKGLSKIWERDESSRRVALPPAMEKS